MCETECSDTQDNDNDGLIDCCDAECFGRDSCADYPPYATIGFNGCAPGAINCVLCWVVLCWVVFCFVVLGCVVLDYVVLCLGCAVLCCVTLCCVTLCCVDMNICGVVIDMYDVQVCLVVQAESSTSQT